MNKWLGKQSDRINGLSLRERAFMFFSLLVCVVGLGEIAILSPAKSDLVRVTQLFERQSVELKRLRSDLELAINEGKSLPDLRSQSLALKQNIDGLDVAIKNESKGPSEIGNIELVLTNLLRSQPGLTLVKTSVWTPKTNPIVSPVGNQPEGIPQAGLISKSGAELTLSGSYPDLQKYVQTLEREMPGVRWGSMSLKSQGKASELTLQLFVVGVQK